MTKKHNRSEASIKQRTAHKAAKRQKERSTGKYRPRDVFDNARKNDRQNERKNDLTRLFVKDLIAKGCCYCGEQNQRIMTLDRIDNTLGHFQSNVNPSCMRCNIIRNNMPYKAWLKLIPTIKQIREEGLFGTWISGRYQFLENLPII